MIGYYIHHHGRGHLGRAGAVAAAADEPVVALSSLPEPTGAHAFAGWVQLAPDPALADADDPTAGGALHWAPLNSSGYTERMAQLHDWLRAARPRLLVVDVSVEVALAARLAGTPIVVVTLPGDRTDLAHELAYRAASLVVAPWPGQLCRPATLHRFVAKTVFTGALSRFDNLAPATSDDGDVLVLQGGGGSSVSADQVLAAQQATGRRWTVAGGAGPWVDDVWPLLGRAGVVVTHAGLNAVAEVAAARRPAVVIAAARPFDEQRATARALDEAGLATVLPAWPSAPEWPAVLQDAQRGGGLRWSQWNDGHAAERFAGAVQACRG